MSEFKWNLFTVLERGDSKIEKIKKKIIALMGLTRSGKSCTFNWILGKKMIGKKNKIQTNYATLVKDEKTAVSNDGFTSVTFIPNCVDLDDETTLIDLAGFQHCFDQVGTLGVSYFLKSILEKAEEVKFLLVVTQNSFFDILGVGWTKTILGFLNIFKPEDLTPEIKDKISSSVSLVITRAKNPQNHSQYMRMIAQHLKHPEFNIRQKEYINEMMARLISDRRIYAFKVAQPNQNPEPCKMIEHFNLMDWNFLKLREIEKINNQNVINISLRAIVQSLPKNESKALLDAIHGHMRWYVDFYLIPKQLMDVFQQNWLKFVEKKEVLNENFMDEILNFQKVFSMIQIFLKNTDQYKSDQPIDQQLKITYSRPSLVQAIKNILKIYTISESLGSFYENFYEKTQQFTELFFQLAHCILPFCINSHQERLVLRLVFVLRRFFHELSKLSEIYYYTISSIPFDMKERVYLRICEQRQYLDSFMKQMNIDILTKLFKTIPQVQEYQELYQHYKGTFLLQNMSQDQERVNDINIEFNKQSINISFVKSSIYEKNNDKIGAICNFIEILRLLCQQGDFIAKSINQPSEQQLNDIYLMKLRIIKKIVSIIMTLKKEQYPTIKKLAISLCVHINQVDMTSEVYDAQLNDFLNQTIESCEILQQYANHCIFWGLYQKAKALLQRKLKLQDYNIQERKKTIDCLYDIANDQYRYVQDQKCNIRRLQERLPQNDDEFLNLLEEIQRVMK